MKMNIRTKLIGGFVIVIAMMVGGGRHRLEWP